MNWEEKQHPIWGKGGIGENVHSLGLSVTFPKKQWRSGKFSIIEPCGITFGAYELFDGKDVYRFDTLEEAKQKADNIMSNQH